MKLIYLSILGCIRAHGHENHNDHNHLRYRNLGNPFSPPGQCKDGVEAYTVGGVTYACEADFNEKGGQCRTANQTPGQKQKFDKDFKVWKEKKEKEKEKRRLDGCGTEGCSGIDWKTEVITIPMNFHIIYDGENGRKYTCGINGGNCDYIQNSVIVLNEGFRGKTTTMFEQNEHGAYLDTKIQFCLEGVTNTENSVWYKDKRVKNMKVALDSGGMETLNVYVNTAGGSLGYAYYPQESDHQNDGVVILNESMPNGVPGWKYAEGDTLTHEVGHWLGLQHTHSNGCGGVGDYMDDADGVTSNEETATFDCPIGLDNCNGDGGPNPIHSFMAYTQDNCMTEFSEGQAMRMQAAYEMYRYKDGYSKNYFLDADGDGYSCSLVQPPTTPGPEPTTTDATTVTTTAITTAGTTSDATTSTTTATTTPGTACKGNNAGCNPNIVDACCSENYSCVPRGQGYACKSNNQ